MDATLHAQLATRGRIDPVALENLKEVESESLLQVAVGMRGRLYGLFDAAQEQGDLRTAATISEKILKYQDFIARLLGDLRTGSISVTQNVLVMPQYHGLRVAIMGALKDFPAARASVAAALKQLESPDLPQQETAQERAAAAGEIANDREVTRKSRAKRQGQVIEGEASRVDPS